MISVEIKRAVVHFSGGDIAVSNKLAAVLDTETKEVKYAEVVTLAELHDNGQIGSECKDQGQQAGYVALSFFKPESIDVVISALQKAKQSLMENKR
jgi:hypothetical protein